MRAASESAPAAQPSCRCLGCGSAPSAGALRVLIGVLSGPRGGKARRAAIRDSWMRYSDVGVRLTVCFVLGEHGLSRRARRSLDAPDVIWMDVEETGILSIPKCFEWWRTASRTASQFSHIAKVDDDTFVHVPKFMHALGEAVHRVPEPLVFGPMAHAGYRPHTFRMCGWSWQKSRRAWHQLKCGERGFSALFPFPLGAMQVLSSGLAHDIGTWSAVHRFVAAANASSDLRQRESNEDVALGYWIAEHAARQRANVSYVMINDRAPNLGCFRDGGLYRRPRAEHIVIHRVKGAEGMTYVWRQLHDGASHDPLTCARDASIELPRNSFLFQPAFASRVRNGSVELTFNQKTNKVSIVFKPRPLKDLIKK